MTHHLERLIEVNTLPTAADTAARVSPETLAEAMIRADCLAEMTSLARSAPVPDPWAAPGARPAHVGPDRSFRAMAFGYPTPAVQRPANPDRFRVSMKCLVCGGRAWVWSSRDGSGRCRVCDDCGAES